MGGMGMNMNLKNSKALALASVALFVFGAAGKTEAASPEKQVELLAKQTAVWGSDQFYRDWQKDQGYCAVTDLDGNGRLELFFVRGRMVQSPDGYGPQHHLGDSCAAGSLCEF